MSFIDRWDSFGQKEGGGVILNDVKIPASNFILHEVGFAPRLKQWEGEGISSPFWRFYFNEAPGNRVEFQGSRFPLDGRRALIVPERTTFAIHSLRPVSHFWVHFSIPTWEPSVSGEPLWVPVDPVLRQILGKLRRSTSAASPDTARIYYLVAAALNLAFASANLYSHSRIAPELFSLVRRIHAAPQEDWPNSRLARILGVTPETLIRRFRAEMDTTPAHYVSLLRVRLAIRELLFTPRTLEEIAEACGFPNRHYFTRIFSRQMECGPAEFRRRYRQPLPERQEKT